MIQPLLQLFRTIRIGRYSRRIQIGGIRRKLLPIQKQGQRWKFTGAPSMYQISRPGKNASSRTRYSGLRNSGLF